MCKQAISYIREIIFFVAVAIQMSWYLNDSYTVKIYNIDIRAVEKQVKMQMYMSKYFQARLIMLVFAIIEVALVTPITPVPWAGCKVEEGAITSYLLAISHFRD